MWGHIYNVNTLLHYLSLNLSMMLYRFICTVQMLRYYIFAVFPDVTEIIFTLNSNKCKAK